MNCHNDHVKIYINNVFVDSLCIDSIISIGSTIDFGSNEIIDSSYVLDSFFYFNK